MEQLLGYHDVALSNQMIGHPAQIGCKKFTQIPLLPVATRFKQEPLAPDL